jgi:hypothetical protein
MADWMETVAPKVPTTPRTKKARRKRLDDSTHRERKLAAHTTINGKGKIARLKENSNGN